MSDAAETKDAEMPQKDAEMPSGEKAAKEEPTEVTPNNHSIDIQLERTDASFLLENDGSRARRVERLAGCVDLDVQPSGEVTLKLKSGKESKDDLCWAEECLRAVCCQRLGQNFDIHPDLAKRAGERELSVMNVPKDACKGYILGKAGGRLLELSDKYDVCTVFVTEKQTPELLLEVGALVEAKFGDVTEKSGDARWFEARIEKVSDKTVTVTWTYDEEQPKTEVDKDNLRPNPAGTGLNSKEPATPTFEVGMLVEAKFGDKPRKFEAKILQVNKHSLKVKWTYDDDVPETEVDIEDVTPPAVLEMEKLHVYGCHRGRMHMELIVLNLIETKLAGHVSNKPRESDTCEGVGWTVVPLLNDGEFKAKVVGKSGSMRMKIAKAGGCGLEYVGNLAYMVGTLQERQSTSALLDLVQTPSKGGDPVEAVPDILASCCTTIDIPEDASQTVTGKARADLNYIEESVGVLSFWVTPKPKEVKEDDSKPKLEISEGSLLDGLFKTPKGDRWFEAKVLEIVKTDDAGKRTVKVQWTYDDDVEPSEVPEHELRALGEGGKDATAPGKALAIFGPERSRKAAELRVMAAVETRCPGTFPIADANNSGDGFGVEAMKLTSEELGRCSQQRPQNVAAATSCIVEKVGAAMYFAGSSAERAKAKEYIELITAEKPNVADTTAHDDIDVALEKAKIDHFASRVIESLEKDTQTIVILETEKDGARRLLVCGTDSCKRATATTKAAEIQERPPWNDCAWADVAWDKSGSNEDGYGRGEKRKEPEKPTVVYIVTTDEEERRKKRAARFA